jgi:ADP-heptose:LPS heptosyltransferase
LIRFFFNTSGIKSAAIDKGRKEKKQITVKINKRLFPLKTTFQRYADVFISLGLPVTLSNAQQPFRKQELSAAAVPLLSAINKNICIAPFAKHREKMYPAEKMRRIIKDLVEKQRHQVFLLGGGKDEAKILSEWADEFPGVINLAGKFSLREELAIISNMDLMISMDSANMHLASLYGVPVVSIWGATHPFAGFYGWAQREENAVQIDLYCRPCSVFGNKPCYRGDHACMELLPEQMITQKIVAVLND